MWTRFIGFVFGPIGMWLAIVAIATAALAGAYTIGHVRGSNKAEVRQLEATVDQLRRVIERREAATRADNAQREIDRAELERLTEENRKLDNELKDLRGGGISADTANRVRRRWGR
jgi:outer membrane murein-binding lipoprotein Lpp